MKYLLLLLSFTAFAQTGLLKTPNPGYDGKFKVMVIDTGVDIYNNDLRLCKAGHWSFDGDLMDHHGHGTHITSLIQKKAGPGDYCFIICKYYDVNSPAQSNVDGIEHCEKLAVELKVNIINISGGGRFEDPVETFWIKKALDNHIAVVAAAMNNSNDLKVEPWYPAMSDPRVIVVGALFGINHAPFSNYGKAVDIWQQGYHIEGILPGNKVGYMSGTSQAAALESGLMLHKLLTQH